MGVLFSIQTLLANFSKQVMIKMPPLLFCCAVFVSEMLLRGKAPPKMRWRRSKAIKDFLVFHFHNLLGGFFFSADGCYSRRSVLNGH